MFLAEQGPATRLGRLGRGSWSSRWGGPWADMRAVPILSAIAFLAPRLGRGNTKRRRALVGPAERSFASRTLFSGGRHAFHQ